MNFTAIQIDHWVAQDHSGHPISLKKWPDGWILARRYCRPKPCTIFPTLTDAVTYLTGEQRRNEMVSQ